MISVPKRIRPYLAYLPPFLLLTLLFIAETEVKDRLITTNYRLATIIAALVAYFLVFAQWENKWLAFAVAVVVWVVLVCIQRNYVESEEDSDADADEK